MTCLGCFAFLFAVLESPLRFWQCCGRVGGFEEDRHCSLCGEAGCSRPNKEATAGQWTCCNQELAEDGIKNTISHTDLV